MGDLDDSVPTPRRAGGDPALSGSLNPDVYNRLVSSLSRSGG